MSKTLLDIFALNASAPTGSRHSRRQARHDTQNTAPASTPTESESKPKTITRGTLKQIQESEEAENKPQLEETAKTQNTEQPTERKTVTHGTRKQIEKREAAETSAPKEQPATPSDNIILENIILQPMHEPVIKNTAKTEFQKTTQIECIPSHEPVILAERPQEDKIVTRGTLKQIKQREEAENKPVKEQPTEPTEKSDIITRGTRKQIKEREEAENKPVEEQPTEPAEKSDIITRGTRKQIKEREETENKPIEEQPTEPVEKQHESWEIPPIPKGMHETCPQLHNVQFSEFFDGKGILNDSGYNDADALKGMIQAAKDLGLSENVYGHIENALTEQKFLSTAASINAIKATHDAVQMAKAQGLNSVDIERQALNRFFETITSEDILTDTKGIDDRTVYSKEDLEEARNMAGELDTEFSEHQKCTFETTEENSFMQQAWQSSINPTENGSTLANTPLLQNQIHNTCSMG